MFNRLQIFLCSFFLFCTVQAEPASVNKNHVLFLLRSGHISQAIEAYKQQHQVTKEHDFELIQEMGLLLLEQGRLQSDPEIRLMTIYGAGISLNERALPILEEGIESGVPELQLVSLNFLSQFQNDKADAILQRGMNAAHPLIRLEAAYVMAQKKSPRAYAYTESLMYRFDELTPLFPQFFAMIGTSEATKMLRKLLSNSDEEVRIAAILSAAKYGRDDLLPKIRILASHQEKAQQEAAAIALGVLKDESSMPQLEKLIRSKVPHVQLAAYKSLFDLGREEYKVPIQKFAKEKDLYAITLLGDMKGSQDLLAELVNDSNLQVRVNAAIALLHLQDPRCLSVLASDILLMDSRGLCFSKISSKGKSLHAWKSIPSAKQNLKDNAYAFEVSLNIREDVLEEALDLPEEDFLKLAKVIFVRQQNDLVPLLVDLLEQLNTNGAIALLKEHQQQLGAPLIRAYCTLALYNLKEKGPYADQIRAWVANAKNEDLIQFRPFLPRELRETEDHYQLTPQDNSHLLIASFESLISKKDDKGVDILLDAIQNGNAKNKYALAGLLIRY